MDFDPTSGLVVLYEDTNLGQVWYAQPAFDGNGTPLTTWTVTPVSSANGAAPAGTWSTGVLGKWHFMSDLGAFVAVGAYNNSTGDAAVWLYKPMSTLVPEPNQALALLAGLIVLGLSIRHARRVRDTH
jgi:hypothetical protein